MISWWASVTSSDGVMENLLENRHDILDDFSLQGLWKPCPEADVFAP